MTEVIGAVIIAILGVITAYLKTRKKEDIPDEKIPDRLRTDDDVNGMFEHLKAEARNRRK